MNVNDEGIIMGAIGLVVVIIVMMAVSLRSETVKIENYDSCIDCMIELDVYVDENNVTWIENRELGIAYRVPKEKM